MIFISCSFDPIALPYGEFVQSLFEEYDIQAYIAEHPESEPLPTFLKSKITESEALVALITEQESPWQQTEITWAYELNKPVYGIVQEGVTVRGLLPHITKYVNFSTVNSDTLYGVIEGIVNSIWKRQQEQKQKAGLIAGIGLLGLALFAISKSK